MAKKKKNQQKKEPTLLIDRIIYFIAVLEPLFVLPQAIQIFKDRDASSISILSWTGMTILTSIWVWWAAVHNERVVFIYQALFMIFYTFVIAGALLYGGKWL